MNPGRRQPLDADARSIGIARRVAFAAWLVFAAAGLLSIGCKWWGFPVLGSGLFWLALVAGAVFVLAMVFLTICVLMLVVASRKQG